MVARETRKQNWIGKLYGVCKQQTRTGADRLFSVSTPGVTVDVLCHRWHGTWPDVESTCFEVPLTTKLITEWYAASAIDWSHAVRACTDSHGYSLYLIRYKSFKNCSILMVQQLSSKHRKHQKSFTMTNWICTTPHDAPHAVVRWEAETPSPFIPIPHSPFPTPRRFQRLRPPDIDVDDVTSTLASSCLL